MPSSNARSHFVICLAGHIDHGKSSLVQALTGAAVDRLPEEKRRGITIELGFSHFDADGCRFALIDVPGHERFIPTMVAGASGVDAALLVTAADDSVMPQTREHLGVLELLGVRRGVVAITKCDLADEEQLQMVEMEVADLVGPTFLADAPRIRVSAHSGLGIAELRQALIAAAGESPGRATEDRRFRLPIDRAFSPAGQGAVVTGTVWRGGAQVGDTLHLLPDATPVRIRRMQSQGADVERVAAGERAAINLAGVKATAIRRGDELVTPGAFVPANRHLAEVRLLSDWAGSLRHRQFVRMHLGANQVTAQVLMEQREIAPGQSAFAVVRCRTPIVAEYGQPFVLRQLSPAATIGGGTIVGPALGPTERLVRSLAAAPGLASADPLVRLESYVGLHREVVFDDASESWIGLNQQRCDAVLRRLLEQKRIVRVAGSPPRYVTAGRFQELKQILVRRCRKELERRRPASRIPLSVILSVMTRQATPPVLDALVKDMLEQRELVGRGDRVGLPSGAELSHRQRQTLNTLIAEVVAAGRSPPTLKEFAELHQVTLRDLEPLVQIAIDDGELVRLSPQIMVSRDAIETLRHSLVDYFRGHATAKVGELREQWGITRKHAVPIFEFFDQYKVTVRAGDLRSPGPRLMTPVDEIPK